MPLVPIMPTSGANRCMLPPRPCEQPVARPNSSAINCAGRDALGQGVAVAAVGAEDDVVGPQMGADAGGDRLLADVGVTGAVDQAALMRPGQLLLAAADQNHDTIQRQEIVLAQSGGVIGRS